MFFCAFVGPGYTVLNPWAQILEAQAFVGPGFAVLEPGFAMERLPHETLGANPRSPTSFGLSARPGSAVAKPGFAVEKLPRETFGANPRSLVCHCKRQPPCKWSLASTGLGFAVKRRSNTSLPKNVQNLEAQSRKTCKTMKPDIPMKVT